ncbi:MAG: ribosomal-processing cysteine protease Prp [Ruminococcaceae bacterium]|nr:ribosomal-processing cysteine protease Prp [Oscillospiraceae bacterium]
MITVEFFESEGSLSGFEVKGHALFAAHGSDIVCSAVSSAAIMAANTITEVFGDTPEIETEEGHLLLKGVKSQSSQGVLSGLKLHLEQLAQQYPEHVTVS